MLKQTKVGFGFINLIFVFLLLPLTQTGYTVDTPVLSLADAVGTALLENRELEATRHDQEAAQYGTHEAQGSYLPHLSFSSEYSRSDSDLFSFDPSSVPEPFRDSFDFSNMGFTGAYYSNKFQVSQLIYDRSVIGQIRLSHMQERAAKWQKTGREQQVVYETVHAYLNALRAKELLGVQQQRLKLAEKQLDTAKTAFEAGLRIRTDVLRNKLTRSAAMRDVVSTEIALENAQVALNQVMGIDLKTRHGFEAEELAAYNPPKEILRQVNNFKELFDLAEENNPSISLASVLVEQKKENIEIARGAFLPTVTAGANFGYKDSSAPNLDDQEWGVSAAIQIPIFQGGSRVAKVKRGKEEYNAQRKRHEDTVRSVHTSVEQASLALQEQYRNLQIAIEAENVAQESYERFQNLFSEGLADSLDITQALTELVVARTDVVTARYSYLTIYANLLLATGTIPTAAEVYGTIAWLNILHDSSQ
ncbi:hypothetical protein GF373_04925 [bacterium]|nr:hypothetical protein [bacterium]